LENSSFLNFFFAPYLESSSLDITLEITAVLLGFVSVFLAKKNHIGVYPSGLVSTGIFVYILFKAFLLGDMIINTYYFIMSIYGWYFWSQKKENKMVNKITHMNIKEKKISVLIFLLSCVFIFGIYFYFNHWNNWVSYIDIFTTGIFFVGMWLMAKRKIEHWIFWVIGDFISVPLYLYKGLGIASLQYLIFSFIAIFGYLEWKKILEVEKSA